MLENYCLQSPCKDGSKNYGCIKSMRNLMKVGIFISLKVSFHKLPITKGKMLITRGRNHIASYPSDQN